MVYDRRHFLEAAVNEFAKCIPLLAKEGNAACPAIHSHLYRAPLQLGSERDSECFRTSYLGRAGAGLANLAASTGTFTCASLSSVVAWPSVHVAVHL